MSLVSKVGGCQGSLLGHYVQFSGNEATGRKTQSSGTCLATLLSCISVTDNVKINEQSISIVTGPLYLHTEFEPI